MDVQGGSAGAGATIQTYPMNDSNAQRMFLDPVPSGDYQALNPHCQPESMALVVRAEGLTGKRVIQDAQSGTLGRLRLGNKASWTYEGNTLDSYSIEELAALGWIGVDSAGKCAIVNGPATRWAFCPSWRYQPSAGSYSGAMLYQANSPDAFVRSGGVLVLPSGASCTPEVAVAEASYRGKCRWRYRDRDTSGTWGAWSSWRNGDSGNTTANMGWGTAWVSSSSTKQGTSARGAVVAGCTAFTPSVSGVTRRQVQVQVVKFGGYEANPMWYSCGPTYTTEFGIVPSFELDLSETVCVMAVDGLRVTYDSDWPLDGCTARLTVRDGANLVADATFSGEEGSGTLTVPYDRVNYLPNEGDTVTVEVTLTTVDGIARKASTSVTASYDGGHQATIDPTYTLNGSILTIGNLPEDTVTYMIYDGTMRKMTVAGASGTVKIAPPLGRPYDLWHMLIDPDDPTGETWASNRDAMFHVPPVDGARWVTSQDCELDLCLCADVEGIPELVMQVSPSTESSEVSGRARPLVTYSGVATETWTCVGTLSPTTCDDPDAVAKVAEKILEVGHVYFRDHRGMWRQAGVIGGSIDRTHNLWYRISVDLAGEVW